jgi:hypothetical protein
MIKTRIQKTKSRVSKRRSRLKPDDPITKTVIRLGKLFGMDDSESSSEAFVEQLHFSTAATSTSHTLRGFVWMPAVDLLVTSKNRSRQH